ncbi:hypothetical protein [Hyalangium gracile]|uniref:hypothetical protein n=1 Tax=Hyalangium gracile TaxID=394092 RepID=UPI001CCFC46E|nr:hypothetical protein [Hyalangium gracile]
MGLRELKETAHQQFVRGRFAQCAQTYHQILRLAPRDPNMHVRHAEACRRAGERLQAIASYRTAAELLLELGCESRARGALKAALELDPNDPFLQADVARLGPQHEETFLPPSSQPDELPLLPPLEPVGNPAPPAPSAPRALRATRPEVLLRTPALPPIHRALPSAPSVPPLVPPVLLPAPRVPSASSKAAPTSSKSSTEKLGAAMASAAGALVPSAPRSTTAGHAAPTPRPTPAPLPQQSATAQAQPPVLTPAALPALPARSATAGNAVPSIPPRVAPHAPRNVLTPPPPPREALFDTSRALPVAPPAPEASTPAPSKEAAPRLEVRRLSATALAFRSSPHDSWAVIRSHSPLEMHLVESLDQLPPMMRDFTVDITVEPSAEPAPSAVH